MQHRPPPTHTLTALKRPEVAIANLGCSFRVPSPGWVGDKAVLTPQGLWEAVSAKNGARMEMHHTGPARRLGPEPTRPSGPDRWGSACRCPCLSCTRGWTGRMGQALPGVTSVAPESPEGHTACRGPAILSPSLKSCAGWCGKSRGKDRMSPWLWDWFWALGSRTAPLGWPRSGAPADTRPQRGCPHFGL